MSPHSSTLILDLLIISMVVAALPLSTVDVPVELPVSNALPQPRPDKPVFLTIKSDLCSRSATILQRPAKRCQTVLDQHTGHAIASNASFLRADEARLLTANWMSVMNLLRDAGYLKIALVGLEDTGQSSGVASPSAAGAPRAPTSPQTIAAALTQRRRSQESRGAQAGGACRRFAGARLPSLWLRSILPGPGRHSTGARSKRRPTLRRPRS